MIHCIYFFICNSYFFLNRFTGVGQVVITASLRIIAKSGETEDDEDSDQFKPSHELLVSVADSGKGIPKEKFNKVKM